MRLVSSSLTVAALASFAMLTGCAGAVPTDQLSADDMSGLDKTVRKIVNEVLEDESLAELCAGDEARVRAEVRSATMTLVFMEGLSNPREPGTAAGQFLADQCKRRFPDYVSGSE